MLGEKFGISKVASLTYSKKEKESLSLLLAKYSARLYYSMSWEDLFQHQDKLSLVSGHDCCLFVCRDEERKFNRCNLSEDVCAQVGFQNLTFLTILVNEC